MTLSNPNMPQRQLGTDGPMVGAIGFGAMSFAGFFGAADDEVSLTTLQAAVEAGIDFWDTANIYGMGRSESIIGRYFREVGDPGITLATKASIIPGPPRKFSNDADHLRSELESSLTKLNRSKVELFYAHRRDQSIEIETLAETMAGFIQEGLIDGYGLSEVAPSTIRRAHAVAPVRAVQNEYSLWTRLPELGILQTCDELGVAFVPFSPLARGALGSVVLDPATFSPKDFRSTNPRFTGVNWGYNLERIKAFHAYAESRGTTTTALALAWVLNTGDNLIPIPGTRTPEHLNEWLPALSMEFSEDDFDAIEEILPVGWAYGDRYNDSQSIGPERYC
ncbi:General stress protein 69 [Aquimixticola soesokkakensis]|uniref:General stress protein 69 n=1 Tax=Aquimixticola soesokkakensis TaxID=1519096 RepID=A0A1Y5TD54_9RHOB|nr:aldo/keto reductase [Aquimixticola soesokkakensis]SLN61049.1 General stress protein 69 [Aquimixticola soesokkakensis]